MARLKELLDELLDESEKQIKEQIIDLVKQSKADDEQIIREMGELTEKYIEQRANDDISDSEFKELMDEVLDLDDMQYNKLSAQAKVSADKIRDALKDLVLNKLIALV